MRVEVPRELARAIDEQKKGCRDEVGDSRLKSCERGWNEQQQQQQKRH
jgi:hypothetical protein